MAEEEGWMTRLEGVDGTRTIGGREKERKRTSEKGKERREMQRERGIGRGREGTRRCRLTAGWSERDERGW